MIAETDRHAESRASTRRKARAQRQTSEKIIHEAVSFCLDAQQEGVLKAGENRLGSYVGHETWKRFARGWSGQRCIWLSFIARDVLRGRDKLHDQLGTVTYSFVGFAQELFSEDPGTNAMHFQRAFACELAKALPLPGVDQPLIAVGRGLQFTGIVACMLQGYDLQKCACFLDVVKEGGQVLLQSLLTAAIQDWGTALLLPVVNPPSHWI